MKVSLFPLAALLIVLTMASDLFAQGRGGRGGRGGGGPPGGGNNGGMPNRPPDDWRDRGERRGPLWEEDLTTAMDHIKESKDKIIIYYTWEGKAEIDVLYNEDLRSWVEDNATMVRNELDKENQTQKDLNIQRAPTFVGFDKYLNEFARISSVPTGDQLKAFITNVQEQAKKFQDLIKGMQARAMDYIDKGDESRAVPELVKILNTGKKGYPEIEGARDRIAKIAESQFAKAKILLSKPETEKEGLNVLESVIKSFKGLSQALIAELEIAHYLSSKGEISGAIERINRVLRADAKQFKDEIVKAQDMLSTLVTEGINNIRAALMLGIDGDLDSAKKKIEKIKKDYTAASEVAKHATDVLRDLEK